MSYLFKLPRTKTIDTLDAFDVFISTPFVMQLVWMNSKYSCDRLAYNAGQGQSSKYFMSSDKTLRRWFFVVKIIKKVEETIRDLTGQGLTRKLNARGICGAVCSPMYDMHDDEL